MFYILHGFVNTFIQLLVGVGAMLETEDTYSI